MEKRTALITGATDGIGKATAGKLLRDGWRVVVVGRSPTRCQATVEELRRATPGGEVDALAGDLSLMAQVRQVADTFRAGHRRLDALILNANAITSRRALTAEGFESNLAVGYLGRALLTWSLEDLLGATPGAQVLTVVGLNLDRFDLSDPTMSGPFSSMKALGRWQWAMQVFSRELNRRSPVPMNTFMPGLVKTKILADEPQPMRTFVRLATALFGITVERSATEVAQALEDVSAHGRRDGYYARTTFKGARDLKERPGDGALVWQNTERILEPFRRA